MTPTDRVSALENLLQRIRENAKAPRPVRARPAPIHAAPIANAVPLTRVAPSTSAASAAPATEPTSELLPDSIPPDALITQPPPTVDPASLRSEPPEEPTLVRQHPPDLEGLAAATSGDEPILEVEFDEIEIVDEATLEAGKIPPPRPALAPPGADGQGRAAPPTSPIASMAREAERADAERVAARASDRVAAARAAAEKLAREKAEEKRRAAEEARERAEAERFERELEEKERKKAAEKDALAVEAARLAREASDRIEAARLAREQAEQAEAERAEQARKAERDRIEAQRLEREAAEREEAERRAREQAEREQTERRAREQAEREAADREEAERRSREEAERVTAETVPSASEKSGVVEVDAAPISSRQPRADDYPDDGFGDLMDDEQPPESGEVASQRKPTVHDEPTLVASGLAEWVDEEPPPRRNVHEAETVLADLATVLRAPPASGEDATALHTDTRKDLTPPPPAIVNPPPDPRAEMVRRPAHAGDAATFVGNLRAQRVVSFGELLDDSLSLAGDDDGRPTTQ